MVLLLRLAVLWKESWGRDLNQKGLTAYTSQCPKSGQSVRTVRGVCVCGAPLPCSMDVAPGGAARTLWGRSSLSCNSCHALPTWGGRQNLLPSDPPAAVYSFYLLGDNGSTTGQQVRGIIYALNSKVIYLVSLLRHLSNISELMVEFKTRARPFNSIGKTEFCCMWKAVCLPLAPSLKFW